MQIDKLKKQLEDYFGLEFFDKTNKNLRIGNYLGFTPLYSEGVLELIKTKSEIVYSDDGKYATYVTNNTPTSFYLIKLNDEWILVNEFNIRDEKLKEILNN